MRCPTATTRRSVVVQDRPQGMLRGPMRKKPRGGSAQASPLWTEGGGMQEVAWWTGNRHGGMRDSIVSWPVSPLCHGLYHIRMTISHIPKTVTNYMWPALLFVNARPTRRLLAYQDEKQSVSCCQAHCPGPGKP